MKRCAAVAAGALLGWTAAGRVLERRRDLAQLESLRVRGAALAAEARWRAEVAPAAYLGEWQK